MQRLVIDLPDAMRIALEDRAEARAVSVDQVIREALVVMGIGDASHVVGVQDGTVRTD